MQNVSAVSVPLDPLATYIYTQHETNHRSPIIDPQMFIFMEKRLYGPFSCIFQLPQAQGYSHFEEVVYFLPLSSQKSLVGVLIFYQPLKEEQYKYQNLIQGKEYRSLCS